MHAPTRISLLFLLAVPGLGQGPRMPIPRVTGGLVDVGVASMAPPLVMAFSRKDYLGYSGPAGSPSRARPIVSNQQVGARASRAWNGLAPTELRPLPGDTWSDASGVNATGTVVGSSGHGDFYSAHQSAVLWTPSGLALNLGALPGFPYCEALEISDTGQVVGNCSYGSTPTEPSKCFSWAQSTGMVDIGTLPGTQQCVPSAVNNNGQVIGNSTAGPTGTSPGTSYGWSWTPKSNMVSIAPPGYAWSEAAGLNNSGEVVGVVPTIPEGGSDAQSHVLRRDRAFSWTSAGGLRYLERLNGEVRDWATGVNDSGQVVGVSQRQSNNNVGADSAVIWTADGHVSDIGHLPGNQYAFASAINGSGQVIGTAWNSAGTDHLAFFWPGTGDPVPITAVGALPIEIADNGEVAGNGWANNSPDNPYIWTVAHGLTRLGPLPSDVSSTVEAISSTGLPVGFSVDAKGNSRAVVWGSVPSTPCHPVLLPDSEPKVIVLLAPGVGSSEDQNHTGKAYDPLSATIDYCNSGTMSPEPALHDAVNYFGDDNGNLVNTLARGGALILPYSYKGAGMPPPGEERLFHAYPYPDTLPGDDPPTFAAGVLSDEIDSIGGFWPSSKIVIIGHSEGGLVAQLAWQFFNTDPRVRGSVSLSFAKRQPGVRPSGAQNPWQNVVGVYSLDSPISGISHPYATMFCSGVHVCPEIGSQTANWWALTWFLNRNDNDVLGRAIRDASQSDNDIFTPVGNRSDWAWQAADLWDPPGIVSQLAVTNQSSCNIIYCQNYDWFGNDEQSCIHVRPPGEAYASHHDIINCRAVVNLVGTQLGLSPNARVVRHAAVPKLRVSRTGRSGTEPRLSTNTLVPSQRVTITGGSLGTRSGRVLFAGSKSPVQAKILAWTSKNIKLVVPELAVTGTVDLFIPGQPGSLIGPAVVLGKLGRARSVSVSTDPATLSGQAMTINVRVAKADRRPYADAKTYLSDGIDTKTAVTNGHGIAKFSVVGFGTQRFVAYCGRAYSVAKVKWAAPSEETVTLTPSVSTAPPDSSVAVLATVLDASSHPIPRASVTFQAFGLPSARLSRNTARTNNAGQVKVMLKSSASGIVVVGATTNNFMTSGAVRITFA
jgi:uncharacterized membrane protein